jgi:hypothetical protein
LIDQGIVTMPVKMLRERETEGVMRRQRRVFS